MNLQAHQNYVSTNRPSTERLENIKDSFTLSNNEWKSHVDFSLVPKSFNVLFILSGGNDQRKSSLSYLLSANVSPVQRDYHVD